MTADYPARLASLSADRLASRLWRKDTAIFAGAASDAALRDAITGRLGWLDAPDAIARLRRQVTDTVERIGTDGLTDVVLLGMGGSSLCAEVLRDVAAGRPPARRLTVLDTTDERTIVETTRALRPDRTIFIVASKSGSTIEVDSLERHFFSIVERTRGSRAGEHFLAITDPGTPLTTHAASRGYRQLFVNAPDIGGRYSALSLFGIVPAALLGMDLDALAAGASRMAAACRQDASENPGLALGAFMAACHDAGRDKLTLLLPTSLAPLGAWIEQLVAESTGKHGLGLLPIVGEPIGAASEYGADRAFVAVAGGIDDAMRIALERAGHPVLVLDAGPESLGAEFFRWEFATAIAGAAIGVNPFDEPNVREAKMRTQAQLEGRRKHGRFEIVPPFVAREGILERAQKSTSTEAVRDRSYLAILDYLPADPSRGARIGRLRAEVRARARLATTHGIGPRYLHSTGQYHKGGPNTGRFVLLTAADETTTTVPGTDYTFSALKYAQALGDFEALAAAGRDVVHWHVERAGAVASADLERMIAGWI